MVSQTIYTTGFGEISLKASENQKIQNYEMETNHVLDGFPRLI